MAYLNKQSLQCLNESFEFFIKNFKDLFKSGLDQFRNSEIKIRTIKRTFDTYWKLDDEQFKELFLSIVPDIIEKEHCDVIDLKEINRFLHLRLFIDFNFGDNLKEEKTMIHMYELYYRLTAGQYPSYFTKYTLPYSIDDRYLVYLTFDEDEINNICTLVSDDMYNIGSPVDLYDITNMVPKSLFTKLQK